MAILKLAINKPIEASLKQPTGKFQPARNRWPGDDASIMYTLTGGDIFALTGEAEAKVYLPVDSDQVFADQNIGAGDLFRICKRKTTQKGEYLEVKALSEAAEPALDPRRYPDENGQVTPFDALPTEINATQTERKLTTSINQARQQKAQQVISAPAGPQSAQTSGNPIIPNVTAAPSTGHATGQTLLSQLLAGCMIAAIDSAVIARDYAHTKGLTLSLSEESVQDLATSLLIHLQRMAEMECRYDLKANAALARVQGNGGHQSWRQ